MFCQNSPPCHVCLGWPYMAWHYPPEDKVHLYQELETPDCLWLALSTILMFLKGSPLHETGSGKSESKHWISGTDSLVAHMVKICLQHRRPECDAWVGKIPQRRKWQLLQYLCQENSMHEGAMQSTGSQSVRLNWMTNTFTQPCYIF